MAGLIEMVVEMVVLVVLTVMVGIVMVAAVLVDILDLADVVVVGSHQHKAELLVVEEEAAEAVVVPALVTLDVVDWAEELVCMDKVVMVLVEVVTVLVAVVVLALLVYLVEHPEEDNNLLDIVELECLVAEELYGEDQVVLQEQIDNSQQLM